MDVWKWVAPCQDWCGRRGVHESIQWVDLTVSHVEALRWNRTSMLNLCQASFRTNLHKLHNILLDIGYLHAYHHSTQVSAP
jgi:hypothetical protein